MHTPTGVILALVVKLVLSSQRNGSEQAPLLLGRSLLGAATGGTRDVSVAAEERRVFQSSLISGKTAGVLGGSLLHELEETGVDRGKGKVQPEHGTEAERQSQNLDIERIRVPGILVGLLRLGRRRARRGLGLLRRLGVFDQVLHLRFVHLDASHGRLDSHRRRNSEHGGNRDHRARASDICDDVLMWRCRGDNRRARPHLAGGTGGRHKVDLCLQCLHHRGKL
mmetsp:Transcript_15953/g.45689  ORF Transcript_15953/g.45689 Transcript_15953/m.45689 type:complete len:224 (+) Transcript_15953:188-859(+)